MSNLPSPFCAYTYTGNTLKFLLLYLSLPFTSSQKQSLSMIAVHFILSFLGFECTYIYLQISFSFLQKRGDVICHYSENCLAPWCTLEIFPCQNCFVLFNNRRMFRVMLIRPGWGTMLCQLMVYQQIPPEHL